MFDRNAMLCRLRLVLLAGVLLGLGACAYGGNLEDPFVQKFAWFSLLNGDDLRETCGTGTGANPDDRYRFVYNARYTKHVRVYDLTVGPDGSGTLLSRVQLPENLSRLVIDSPGDLLSPWRWNSATTVLTAQEVSQLTTALTNSGFGQEPPVGRWLDSRAYYWIAVACTGGRMVFNAWSYPSERYDKISFPAILARFDRTGIAMPPPRKVDPSGRLRARGGLSAREFAGVDFEVEVGANGLVGQR